MSRFEDVSSDVYQLVDKVRENFPALDMALIKVLFDTKKRKSGGKYVLGRIKKLNDELKAFAVDSSGTPYDYVMFLDKLVWENIEDQDKEKLVFHELCHCQVGDGDNPYGIQDHEIQTFYAEIEYCKDDPRWIERVATIADSLYDPDANMAE